MLNLGLLHILAVQCLGEKFATCSMRGRNISEDGCKSGLINEGAIVAKVITAC